MEAKTQDRQHIGTWIEPDAIRELEERAVRADRSRSAELRLAIRQYLNDSEQVEEEDDAT